MQKNIQLAEKLKLDQDLSNASSINYEPTRNNM